ncbi:MAG: GTPase ObgE [Candidatus Harrisonbacteria bacterium CG10_big_fil_rev_8_21_14_0_10_40_38]|uniref:GTPase Obg n=1 Tax=Candidatus Harrisonbacteria bacterium CG10_big_fil_rev_8_21_14_0_10_40_38 TaxID=1974583 RepID=A0A2H0UTQ8_9BACT|nr:MAG: GTPase ObgE [Candidatus Harrisonbacteria bacterium CG10_big_fil_rev_8_21_14_0_10_40_38]
MLIDNVTINVSAGDGGDGAVAFNHIKMALGPTGASGGNGGNVYLEAVADIGALRHFRSKKKFSAEDGMDGRSAFRDGRRGEDLVLKVPRGTVVHIKESGSTTELIASGERVLVAKGGKGGRGNFHFRSSTNTSPKQFEKGIDGEKKTLELELKLIADIGFVGFPNAGKSSLLNEVTNAQSKIANYPFTTLEPNLGVYHTLILADIPGLIEGASSGKGLGTKFLRHIERTRILFHFIEATDEDPMAKYEAIRNELKKHNPLLVTKPEYILISKSDAVSEERLSKILKTFSGKGEKVFPVSIYDPDEMHDVRKVLDEIEKKFTVNSVEAK